MAKCKTESLTRKAKNMSAEELRRAELMAQQGQGLPGHKNNWLDALRLAVFRKEKQARGMLPESHSQAWDSHHGGKPHD